MYKPLMTAAVALALTACGGGGGDTASTTSTTADTSTANAPATSTVLAVSAADTLSAAQPVNVQAGDSASAGDTLIAAANRGVVRRADIESQDWSGRAAELAALVVGETDADVLAGVVHAAANTAMTEAERQVLDQALARNLGTTVEDFSVAVAAEHFGNRQATGVVTLLTSAMAFALPDRVWKQIAYSLRES